MYNDKIPEIDTKELVINWHCLVQINLEKKPEIIEPNKGKITIKYSILTFQRTYLFNIDWTFVFII